MAGCTPPRIRRTTAETFHAMYPRIDEWLAVRRKVDPGRPVRVGHGAPAGARPSPSPFPWIGENFILD